MVSAEAFLSARVDAGHESSDSKDEIRFLEWRPTEHNDGNITNMSKFSRYGHLLVRITQFAY